MGPIHNLETDMPTALEGDVSAKRNGFRRVFAVALLFLGSLAVALTITTALFVMFGKPIDLEWAKPRIESLASEALQRPVALEGRLLLVPAFPLAAQIEDLRIGNPVQWPQADFVHLQSARAELSLHRLLRGELQIGEVEIAGLDVNLETNADGERNWLLAASATEPRPGPTAPSNSQGPLRLVELEALDVRDIVVRHRDARTGEDFTVELVEITGSALDHEPMALLVLGTIQKHPYSLEATAGSLADLFYSEEPWPIEVNAKTGDAELSLSGQLTDPLRGQGIALDVQFSGGNLAEVGALIGAETLAIEPVTLNFRLEQQGNEYRATNVRGEIGTTVLEGRFSADLASERPQVSGEFSMGKIDIGPLSAAVQRSGAETSDQGRPVHTPDEPESHTGVASLDLDRPVLQLDLLRDFDARLAITVDAVVNGPADMRDISLAVDIENGRLFSATMIEFAEVPFRGALTVGTEKGQPALRAALSAESSDIGELASLVTNTETVAGSFGTAELNFISAGASIREFVKNAELRLELADADLSYGDESDDQQVEFSLDRANLFFPASGESSITMKGALLGEPFDVSLRGGTFIQNFVDKEWPIALEATGGGATLALSGTIRNTTADNGSAISLRVSGRRIGGLATWLGINRNATQSYALSGSATHSLSGLRIKVDEARIGDSAFTGNAGIRRDGKQRITFATLVFRMLDLEGFNALAPEAQEPAPTQATAVGPDALTIDVPVLPNGIEIFDSDIDLRIARINLRQADVTDFSFSSNIRNGHVDRAPIAATLGDTQFDGSLGIDLRGDIPKVRLVMGSRGMDVGALLAQLGITNELALHADSFAMDVALQGSSTSAMLRQSTLLGEIRGARWAFTPPGARRALDIELPRVTISAAPEQPITLDIDALIRAMPATIRVTTDTLGSFATPKQMLQMGIDVAIAGAELTLHGETPLPIDGENLAFSMDLQGERLSDYDELLDVAFPPIGPYALEGRFGSRPSGYYIEDLQASIGTSVTRGSLNLDTANQPPKLRIDLIAKRIQLDDFRTGEWSPTGQHEEMDVPTSANQAPEEVRPRGRALLSQEVLDEVDVRATLNVNEVLSGDDRLGRGIANVSLGNGRLELSPLHLEVPGGTVALSFALEPDEDSIALEAATSIDQLDYGLLARRIDPESTTGGKISLDVDLKTRGPDIDNIMQHANGHIDFAIWPNDLNAEVFELWAVSVLSALMREVDKEKQSRVHCVIASFVLEDGLMSDRVLFADTTRMRVTGTAEVDFKQRSLRVRAGPRAKRPEFFSLAVPVGLRGKFDDFRFNINPIELTGQALSFVTSPAHVPIRRIFKSNEPIDSQTACAEAWAQRNQD